MSDPRSAMERALRALGNVSDYLIMNEQDHNALAADLAGEIEQAEADATERERQRCATADNIDLPKLLAEARSEVLADIRRIIAEVGGQARMTANEPPNWSNACTAIDNRILLEFPLAVRQKKVRLRC